MRVKDLSGRILKIAALVLALSLVYALTSGEEKAKYSYVGSSVCAECHAEDAIGNQTKIWLASPHAKAWSILGTKFAAAIARKNGVANPQADHKCLKCHTTGEGKSPVTAKEGVGCEACHGPASEYYRPNVHVDYISRENGYRRAVKAGMYPIRGIKSLKIRERLCLSCHVKTRPCFPENGNPYDFVIPIQTVDSLQKGEVNFRHPLRR